jgi:hypothetical protein
LLALLGAHPILHVSRIRVKQGNQKHHFCEIYPANNFKVYKNKTIKPFAMRLNFS